MFEKQAKNVILAIGSNLGNKQHNIEKTKYFLNSDEKIKIMSSSAFYRTESWPNKKDPYFLNIDLKCITTFNPGELFTFIKKPSNSKLVPVLIIVLFGTRSLKYLKRME